MSNNHGANDTCFCLACTQRQRSRLTRILDIVDIRAFSPFFR